MTRFWTATLRHYIGSTLVECEIKDIPAVSSAEARQKALRMYKAKIAPGAEDEPAMIIAEDKSVITGVVMKQQPRIIVPPA